MFDLFLFRTDRIHKGVLHDVLLAYTSGYVPNPNKLATRINEEFQKDLRPDEVLIIIAETQLEKAIAVFSESRELSRLIQNNSNVKYHICAFNRNGETSKTRILAYKKSGLSITPSKTAPLVPFQDLARQMITTMYCNREITNSHQSNFHYIKPSGKHTDLFLRASKLFTSSVEISFFALICLKFFPRNTTTTDILIDSPVIMGLAHAIVDLISLASHNPIQPVNIVSFGSFPGITDTDNHLLHLRDIPDETFIIISASTSGRLLEQLQRITRLPECHFAHFLYLHERGKPENSFSSVCDLSYDKKRNPSGLKIKPNNFEKEDCPLCKRGSFGIRLLGDHFDPAPPKADPVAILKADAPKGITNLHKQSTRIFGKQIFQVGTSNKERGSTYRHFHVDEKKLFTDDDIMDRLKYLVSLNFPLNPQEIIYIDDGSKIFAEKILDITKSKVPLVKHNDLLSRNTMATNPIVVCAAVIESGRTLQEVSRDLRSIATDQPIVYFILFAKSTSSKKIKALRDNLSMTALPGKHKVIIVENIELPVAAGTNAWHLESEFIAKNNLTTQKYWKERFRKVSAKDYLIKESIFLNNDRNQSQKFQLQEGFVFFPNKPDLIKNSSEFDIYVCISMVLQNLRTREPDKSTTSLKSTIYNQGLLSAGNFSRFNDSILHVCLLRACLPSELNYSDHANESREMARIIKRILCSCETERGEAAMEFLFALGARKLILCPDDLHEILHTDITLMKKVGVRKFFKDVKQILFTKNTIVN